VRGIAELAQHPGAQHHPKPGLAAQDGGVRMGGEPSRELLLQDGDLLVQATERGDQGGHHLPVGALDRHRRGQLWRRQRVMDGHHLRLQVAAPASGNQRPPDGRSGELAALLGRRCQRQQGKALGLAELGTKRGQRARVELSKRATQGVDVPLASPDQALVRAGQHLDRLHQRAVAGDLAMVVPVGADQIGQHLSVPTIGLGPRAAMATTVAAHHLRVDRVHLVAGRHQRPDQQPPVGLDPDRHLSWVLSMGSHQQVQLADPSQPIGDPPSREHAAVLVEQAQVMVALAPVHPNKQHGILLCCDVFGELEKDLRRPNGSALLARHPTSRPPSPNTGRGTVSPESSKAPKPPSAHRLVAPP
jgi:hypothetical protein